MEARTAVIHKALYGLSSPYKDSNPCQNTATTIPSYSDTVHSARKDTSPNNQLINFDQVPKPFYTAYLIKPTSTTSDYNTLETTEQHSYTQHGKISFKLCRLYFKIKFKKNLVLFYQYKIIDRSNAELFAI
jgi:hypothetical protein